MFAFAIWDRVREQLFLARDRVGKKPLYYRHDGARIWFASEMRAILADGEVPARIDPQAVRGYLALGYVAGDRSVFDGIKRLPPAHRAIFSRSGLTVERYWKLPYEPKATLSESEAAERVRGALDESVRLRLISDVPLGAFLSGGIDSSAVVALMCRQARIPVKTFSIGFDDQQYNELEHARSIARLFHTEHHEFVVSPDLEDVLPKIAWHYGEPYADSSAVPTFHLARLARQHITVALTGDGGDESFAGYRRYVAERLFRTANSLPRLTYGMAAAALDRLPLAASSRSRLYDVRRFLDAVGEPPGFRYASFFGFFATDYSILHPSFERATSAELAVAAFTDAFAAHQGLDSADAAMAADVSVYLPDDLLVKTDIATMAHGVEARSPFLDSELMMMAASLPASMKLRGRTTKALLKTALRGVVPDDILRRPKVGFGVPLDGWLRTSLRDMTFDLLLSPSARQRGYFQMPAVESMLDEHMSGRASHGHRLWALLMLELWHRHVVDELPSLLHDARAVPPADLSGMPLSAGRAIR
jgi:asparagine synthase (glutamine-hydrolysing)